MYQALYRKYRPKTFNEVVSQKAILTTLQNSILNKHIGHAYLFSGPRGTGKTTVAKIFARAVNCLSPNDGNTCEKCDNCKASQEKSCMDIIEIDAASNNGVDEIRELRNKVRILPTELKYKVYIIDEVHMLSIGAFNALLKTLEEPPEHVIFILATTDPQKIPATIISRCQCYNFKKISNSEIEEQLKYIAKQEKLKLEEEVFNYIALSADGGLRDAVGLLDKLSSYQTGKITVDDFFNINGQIKNDELKQLVDAIFSHSAEKTLTLINNYYDSGRDLIQILKQMMLYLRDILVNHYIKSLELKYSEQELIEFINLLNEKLSEIKKTDDVKMYIEIMILHFIKENDPKIISREIISNKKESQKELETQKKPENSKISEKAEPQKNKEEPQKEKIVSKTKSEANYKKTKEIMKVRSKNTLAKAIKLELEKELENWKLLNDFTFDTKRGYLASELLDGIPRASSESTLIISYEYESLIEKIADHLDKLVDFYQKVTNSKKAIAFICDDDWNLLKSEYISLIKKGQNFEVEQEPIFEEDSEFPIKENNGELQEVVDLFGELVEIK